MSAAPRLLSVGEAAFSVEFGAAIDPMLAARVAALDGALRARPPSWLRETVPTYRSLLVVFAARARAEAAADLRALAAAAPAAAPAGRRHEVPVVYGGEAGEDLPEVARLCGMGQAEFVERHAGRAYTAFMLGFMPGFAYLGLLPPEMETPRRKTPRVRVPAGTVAVAGRQTGVYPFASPGGWNLIGRTSHVLFDAGADPPATIQPGDEVVFRPVSALPETAPTPPRAAATSREPALEVLEPGPLTTAQDGGRRGWRRLGVAWAGAMDPLALAAANAALDNAPGAPGLECTWAGPTLRFLRSLRFALAGADLGAVLERADLGSWPVPPGQAVLARAGNVLRFTGRRSGCRAYLALAGGLSVPLVLGSRSTDLGAGFGGLEGRALRAGDGLGVDAAAPAPAEAGSRRLPLGAPRPVELRVLRGPQDDLFDEAAWRAFLDEAYAVQPDSDRVGCRLRGTPLVHRGPAEIVSDGMLPGSIQVPPDGQPIVMGPDGPTTGGYPKIATVIGADLPWLAQLAPGEAVRFREVGLDEALRALEGR